MNDMLGKIVRLIVEVPAETLGTLFRIVELIVTVPKTMLGTLVDLLEKLTGQEGESWFKQFKRFLRKENIRWRKVGEVVAERYSRLVSGDCYARIDRTFGNLIFENSQYMFNVTADDNYRKFGLNVCGRPTSSIETEIRELIQFGK